MIEIEAPDGSVVEFPDGMPDAEIAAAMRRAFGGPAAPAPTYEDDILSLSAVGDVAPIAQPGTMVNIGAGFKQGLLDVGGTMTRGLDYVAQQALGYSPHERIFGQSVQEKSRNLDSNFEQAHGKSWAAAGGRVAGQVAGTAPVLAGGGVVLNAAGRVAPTIAPATRFVAGGGGRASRITSGAVQGGGASALAFGGTSDDLGTDVAIGTALGGAIPAAIPAVKAAGRAVGRALVPTGNVSKESAKLLARTQEMGIPLRSGQISESYPIKTLDSVLKYTPFTGYGKLEANTRQAFNRKVAETFGESADEITPEVMARAKTRIGKVFDDVGSRVTVRADDDFLSQVRNVRDQAGQVLSPDEMKIIEHQISNILVDPMQPGTVRYTIPGEAYQAITRRGAPLDRLERSTNPNVSYYARQIRDALDDAWERSAPDDLRSTFSNARLQWKNMRTVEPLVSKAPDGNISPAQLLGEVRKSYGDTAFKSVGESDIVDLGRIGQKFIKDPIPNSGTAQREYYKSLLGGSTTGLLGVLTGGASLAVAPVASKALNSQYYRRKLIEAALNRSGTPAPYSIPESAVERLAPYGAPVATPSLVQALADARNNP